MLLAAGPTASVDGLRPTERSTSGSDAPIELDFDNQEEGAQHNVVIFDGDRRESAPQLFSGALITGPDKISYAVRSAARGQLLLPLRDPPHDDGRGRSVGTRWR